MSSLKLGFLLFITCSISAVSLCFLYNKTKPIIEERRRMEELKLKKKVLPGAEVFKKVAPGKEIGLKGGREIGKIISVKKMGYSSEIHMLVGIGLDGRITAVRIISQQETPGLGTKICEEWFLKQFSQKDLKEVDMITGATISSRAVIDGVKEALRSEK